MLKKRLFRKYFRRSFTLLELMVAMGVFAIIMLMVLQFFSGAQKVWADVERKNETYGDARIAMDMMATMLQATYYSSADIPFVIDDDLVTDVTQNKQKAHSIKFPTKSELHPENKSNIFYARFGLRKDKADASAGDLLYSGLYDKNEDEDNTPNPYHPYVFRTFKPAVTFAGAKTALTNFFDSGSLPEDKKSIVAKNVTSLEFVPFYLNYQSKLLLPIPAGDPDRNDKIPNMVLIKMTMLNGPDFRQWVEMCNGDISNETTGSEAEKFRRSRERSFVRAVYIGQYNDK